jgi:hypothetical protein
MAYIARNHPVRFLIESAVNGRKLTEKDLDILNNADLPTGESLTAYKAAVEAAARRVASTGADGSRQAAIELAEQEWEGIATRMTPDQLAVDDSGGPDDAANIRTMVAELFDN